jgi:hypothetical protein
MPQFAEVVIESDAGFVSPTVAPKPAPAAAPAAPGANEVIAPSEVTPQPSPPPGS